LRSLRLILIPAIALLLQACGGNEKPDPLAGKWVSPDTDAKAGFVIFNSSTEEFVATGWYPDSIKGTWKHSNDTIYLNYVEPGTYAVDSIVVVTRGDGSTTHRYFSSGAEVSGGADNGLTSVSRSEVLLLQKLNESHLSLTFQGELYSYSKQGVVQSGISFTSVVRGILGLMAMILLTFLFSNNKRKIDWGLVIKGTLFQIAIAFLVLKVPFIEGAFQFVSDGFVWLISNTEQGVHFLFGQIGIGTVQAPLLTFAITVLPTIIFFSALMSMFYYMGLIQKFVIGFAWLMKKFMRMSGAEGLSAAGNIFMGQTEAPLLIKPYLSQMTKSELMCMMTGGMATIAGGVMAAYIVFLGGDDPVERSFFAKHLLTASIMSAPAAIVCAKILIPETEKINENLSVNKEKLGSNILEAISNGTTDGLKLAVNVGAMLLVFVALMAMANGVMGWIGEGTGLNETIAANTPYSRGLSFEFLLGYVGAPIVWLLGVDAADMVLVGELLGQKTVLNEFVAYPRLGQMKAAGDLSEKSVIISTYILCGFANFSSIGIQIGGIGSLVPEKKATLAKLGMRALLGGTVASLMTAAVVGMLY